MVAFDRPWKDTHWRWKTRLAQSTILEDAMQTARTILLLVAAIVGAILLLKLIAVTLFIVLAVAGILILVSALYTLFIVVRAIDGSHHTRHTAG